MSNEHTMLRSVKRKKEGFMIVIRRRQGKLGEKIIKKSNKDERSMLMTRDMEPSPRMLVLCAASRVKIGKGKDKAMYM